MFGAYLITSVHLGTLGTVHHVPRVALALAEISATIRDDTASGAELRDILPLNGEDRPKQLVEAGERQVCLGPDAGRQEDMAA